MIPNRPHRARHDEPVPAAQPMLRTRLVAGTAALCLALVGTAAFSDLTATDAGGADLESGSAEPSDLGRMIEAQSIKASHDREARVDAQFEDAIASSEEAEALRKAAEAQDRKRAADAEAAKAAAAKKVASVKASSTERVAKAKAEAKADLAAELTAERESGASESGETAAKAASAEETTTTATATAKAAGPTKAQKAAAEKAAANKRAAAKKAADKKAAADLVAAKKAADTKAWLEAAKANEAREAAAASAPIPEPWASLAQCESTGNWSINTGNGYYGGLQFNLGTWRAYGGQGMPHQNTPAQQIEVAKKVQAKQGWGAWPSCTRKLGLR